MLRLTLLTSYPMPVNNSSDAIMAHALKLLALRNHSRQELETKLRKKGYALPIITEVLTALSTKGILNDQRFGEELLSSRARRKPAGKMKIRAELLKKGVSEEITKELLNDYNTQELCYQAAMKKLKSLSASVDEQKRKHKLETFLRNRGFTWQDIHHALTLCFPAASISDYECE